MLDAVLTQLWSHGVRPAPQVEAHEPCVHTMSVAHALLQLPQLSPSLIVSTQPSSHGL
jgi:hypothetical protein